MGLQEWIQELIASERESGARLEYIMCGASWGLYRDTQRGGTSRQTLENWVNVRACGATFPTSPYRVRRARDSVSGPNDSVN